MNEISKSNEKRAVIYCRVSTKEQVDEGNSLVTQDRSCREYAQKHGFEVIQAFEERGESAKTINRTSLKALLEYCSLKKNRISAVIVYKIDRLSRSTEDFSHLSAVLRRYSVTLHSATEPIGDDPIGKFMKNTMASIAQLDNDMRAERCSNGMREAVREGRYVWGAPVGYSNVRVSDRCTIAPNEMAVRVREAFEMVATGAYVTDEVWRKSCEQGLRMKKGKAPTKGYFHSMLRNELYAGWMEKFGERHKGIFDAVVSEELFERVQSILKNKGHKVTQYKRDNADFPLRRFVINPDSLKLTGSLAKGIYPYYRFGAKGSNYARDRFEDSFSKLMDSYRFEDTDIQKLKKYIQEKYNTSTSAGRADANKMRKRMEGLDNEETILVKKNMQGVLSDAVLKRELERVEGVRRELVAALASFANSETSPEEAIEFCEEYLLSPSTVWRKADITTKTKLQWFQFPSGVVFDGQIFGTPEIASIFKTKDAIAAPLSTGVDPSGFEPLTSSLQMKRSTN